MAGKIEVPIMWDVQQTHVETGLTVFTIMQWVKSGKVKFIRLGAGKRGKILINAASFCEYMRDGEQI